MSFLLYFDEYCFGYEGDAADPHSWESARDDVSEVVPAEIFQTTREGAPFRNIRTSDMERGQISCQASRRRQVYSLAKRKTLKSMFEIHQKSDNTLGYTSDEVDHIQLKRTRSHTLRHPRLNNGVGQETFLESQCLRQSRGDCGHATLDDSEWTHIAVPKLTLGGASAEGLRVPNDSDLVRKSWDSTSGQSTATSTAVFHGSEDGSSMRSPSPSTDASGKRHSKVFDVCTRAIHHQIGSAITCASQKSAVSLGTVSSSNGEGKGSRLNLSKRFKGKRGLLDPFFGIKGPPHKSNICEWDPDE